MARTERIICSSADLTDSGDGVRFELEVEGKPEPAFAVRYGGRVYAYRNRCAHMPMELDWQPGKFFDVEYPIPAELIAGKDQITVRFQPHERNIAGGVFGCAVMKSCA